MFRQLPKDATLDELWRAGLVYSRPFRQGEWMRDLPPGREPTADPSKWQYAIQVEE